MRTPKSMKIKTLQQMWTHFNHIYFGDKLRPVTIILTRGKKYYGYYKTSDNSGASCITISGSLNQSDTDYRDTLLHEMIHQYLFETGIDKEITHGPHFVELAVRLDVKTDYHEHPR